MATLVWTATSGRLTAAEVVADFARNFWDRPRVPTAIDCNDHFRIVDGVARYRVEMGRGGLWAIYRMD